MAEFTASRLWVMRLAFVGLCIFLIFLHLLPLDTTPRRWAGPDLIVALVFVWSLRRPDYVPVLSVALVMLLSDLMLQRPPALLALLVVLGAEHLKKRSRGLREASFVSEWTSVAIVLIAITLINRVVLTILVVQQAPLGLSIMQMFMTILFYPIVVAFSQIIMGVRKVAPGDVDLMRRSA